AFIGCTHSLDYTSAASGGSSRYTASRLDSSNCSAMCMPSGSLFESCEVDFEWCGRNDPIAGAAHRAAVMFTVVQEIRRRCPWPRKNRGTSRRVGLLSLPNMFAAGAAYGFRRL